MRLRNILLLVGATVGAGVFSMPAVIGNIGVVNTAILLFCIAVAMGYINWAYFKVVRTVSGKHQLAGYISLVLGKKYAGIASASLFIAIIGAMVAYLGLAGSMIANLVSLSNMQGSIIFLLSITIPFLFFSKKIEIWDHFVTVIKILLYGFLISLGIILLFTQKNTVDSIQYFGAPFIYGYGAVLFSLTGFSIVPELKKTPKGTIWFFIAVQLGIALLYFLFGIAFVPYISANGTVIVDGMIARFLDIIGVISIYTPYLLFSWIGYDMFSKDFKYSRLSSQVLIIALPVLFFLIGYSNFVSIISLTGGVFLGSIGVLIIAMYKKLFKINKIILFLLYLMFILGMVVELLLFFFNYNV